MIKARELTRPYWEISERLLERMPKAKAIQGRLDNPVGLTDAQLRFLSTHPEYKRFTSARDELRGKVREKFSEIDVALYLWYNQNGNRIIKDKEETAQLLEAEMREIEESLPRP